MKRLLSGIPTTIRRLAGMPDYERFVAHLHDRHPERVVPSEREYYEEFVRARYGEGPSRCC